eukprot:1148318-Pelagomonas_calceolata.AAC.3
MKAEQLLQIYQFGSSGDTNKDKECKGCRQPDRGPTTRLTEQNNQQSGTRWHPCSTPTGSHRHSHLQYILFIPNLQAGPQSNARADPPTCRAHSSYVNCCRALTASDQLLQV